MPKHEALTPKAISNRIKAKGLQKLRWYCQMCNKQCRDQNGFKCHLTSESHQRQLLLFSEDSSRFVQDFSRDFEKAYLDILRRQFGTKRVHCNMVYQEYIKDRNHVHMNSTKWYTLTTFIEYLGKEGICRVDNTEKGWYVQYIDREEEERREKLAKRQKMDTDDQERIMDMVMKQAEKALERQKDLEGSDPADSSESVVEFKKADDQKIEFKLPKSTLTEKSMISSGVGTLPKAFKVEKKKKNSNEEEKNDKPSTSGSTASSTKTSNVIPPTKKSALDQIRDEEEKLKEKKNRKDYWLHEDIVVKIVTKKLGPQYNKRKAIVVKVENLYTGHVKLLDGDREVIKIDQNYLETVIPAIGKRVLVVNGAYRGCKATLEHLNEDRYCVSVRINEGPANGRLVDNVQYEDVCKLNE